MALDEQDPLTFCTGFMALRPTARTLAMLHRWNVELMKTPQLNQPLWNRYGCWLMRVHVSIYIYCLLVHVSAASAVFASLLLALV